MSMLLLEIFFGSLIGISLGLLGGGGSILAVPIFTYLFKLPAKESIFMSTGVVGLAGMVGTIQQWHNEKFPKNIIFVFGPLSILGTFAGTKIATYLRPEVQLLIFSFFTFAASISMLRGKKITPPTDIKINYLKLCSLGIGVGILTGLIGVGGGFLIVPALVSIAGLPFATAATTSLALITVTACSGFLIHFFTENLNWGIFLPFMLSTTIGVFLSKRFAHRVPELKLKRGFAILLIVVSLLVMFKNHHILEI